MNNIRLKNGRVLATVFFVNKMVSRTFRKKRKQLSY